MHSWNDSCFFTVLSHLQVVCTLLLTISGFYGGGKKCGFSSALTDKILMFHFSLECLSPAILRINHMHDWLLKLRPNPAIKSN